MTRTPLPARVLAGVAALALLTGCASTGSDATATGSPTATPAEEEGIAVNFLELNVGDCFDIPSSLPAGEALRYSSCEVLHQYEAYAQFTAAEGEFPGTDAIDAFANESCEPAFREFVGEAWQQSTYDFQFIVPSEATWDELQDRSVLCMVTQLNELPWTGSAEGTAR